MAIRVRCSNCEKKIAIDEAFAGGVCRCPYCGALNTVAGGSPPAAAAPDRPERPDLPAPPGPGPAARPAAAGEHVPVARPVMIQGVVALIMLAFLLLLVAFSAVFFHQVMARDGDGGVRPEPPPVNPVTGAPKAGAQIAGLALKTPVVFVLDGGSGTGPMLDAARALVRHSILGMKPAEQFNLICALEGSTDVLSKDWVAGGTDGDGKAKAFLANRVARGASDLDQAIAQACRLKPKVIVILAGNKAPASPDAAAEAVTKADARLFSITLAAYEDVNEIMSALVAKTGGQFHSFSASELERWLGEAPPLP